jgi:peptidoglycan-associated lipoprotein
MFRKNAGILVLSLVFVIAMSACSKKQTMDASTEPEITPQPTPPTQVEEPTMSDRDVESEQTEMMPVLEDVFFEFDKSDLSSTARRKLENNARQLKDAMSYSITIEGHCDERGTNAYNLALGERRAKATASFLASLGVASSRIKTVSYGEERPFATGHDESAWAQNRRAHFVVNK